MGLVEGTVVALRLCTTAVGCGRSQPHHMTAAVRYQHATADRDPTLADALRKLGGRAKVVPLSRTKKGRRLKTVASARADWAIYQEFLRQP